MPLNLLLSGNEATDRKSVVLTDVTPDWGVNGNINFTDVLYAELWVGINGAMYGPGILTAVFAAATVQADLVFTITPELLGLDTELFEDSIQEYHYGVSPLANPNVIQRYIWPGETSYDFPIGSSTNKIPFEVVGSSAIREYSLDVDIQLNSEDLSVDPKISMSVNYKDGSVDSDSVSIPKDGVSHTYNLTITVDRAKEIDSVTGKLMDESRAISNGRYGEITSVGLYEQDLDLDSRVLRGLLYEKTKASLDRKFIDFQDDFLCGKRDFDRHEELVIEDLALNSVVDAAEIGLSENAESIINYLNGGC